MQRTIEDVDRAKAFAVAVLSEVWSGVELPEAMVRHAKALRAKMIAEGVWEAA